MRILEVETFGRGGLVHYCYNLSRALGGRGHDVTIATAAGCELGAHPLPPNVRLVEVLGRVTHRRGASLPAVALPWVRRAEALSDVVAVAALARRLRPDVVHLHSTNPIALAHLMLLRRMRARVAVTAHVVTAHERTRRQDAVSRRIHRASPFIIAHSDVDRKRLVTEFGIDPARITVIPHGEYGFLAPAGAAADRTAARHRLGLDSDDEVALFFGYIREYKGLDVLLDAWPAVVRARPRARLVVAGDPVRLAPARRDELAARARSLGALIRFEYIPLDDVPWYLACADALVLPYRHISQSGVLLLALAAGLPVVATRVGGLPGMLEDGESALLVPPESPAALGAALVRVLGDAELRCRLSRGGRRVADAHAWPAIAARTEAAFLRLVEGGRPR
jgi:glycosyltransferase involved in cell wall biosynthesis